MCEGLRISLRLKYNTGFKKKQILRCRGTHWGVVLLEILENITLSCNLK